MSVEYLSILRSYELESDGLLIPIASSSSMNIIAGLDDLAFSKIFLTFLGPEPTYNSTYSAADVLIKVISCNCAKHYITNNIL